MEKYTIASTDEELYEYALESDENREFIIRLVTNEGRITGPKRIHAVNFESAYNFARHYVARRTFDRIASIEEVID